MKDNENLDLTREPALTCIDGPEGEIPLVVAVHDRFAVRLNYFRTRIGVEAKFKCAGRFTTPHEMTLEERVHHLVIAYFDSGHSLVAVGRAEPGESFGDAMSAIEKFEAQVTKQ